MLKDIDGVCQQAGIVPDMFLSGHAHSYQRYTRTVPVAGQTLQVPYLVMGTGGIGAQAVPTANKQKTGAHTYISSFKGYGYMLVKVSEKAIEATMFGVDKNTHAKFQVDHFIVDLVHNTVTQ
jgi:hypothetical protein